MPTIHEQIDELLAADLHGELSATEREAFHAHLVECADCRQAFQQEKNMHKLLNETIADKKADAGFEQRMVARFRDRVPQRPGLFQLVTNLVRLRAVQLTAAAALLLSMVQVGRMITGESMTPIVRREDAASLQDSGLPKMAPGAPRDSKALGGKNDTQGREIDQFADSNATSAAGIVAQNPAAPPAQDEVNTPVEGLRQLPSFVGSTKTKSADDKDEQKANEPRPTSEYESALPPESPIANRKLVRNATAELEVVSFEDSIQRITGFAAEEKGYVATSSSQKQANGKLSGQVVVKILPDNLDRFLQKLRGIGELKNQALTTEDVTKTEADKRAVGNLAVEMITKGGADLYHTNPTTGRLHRVSVKDGQLMRDVRPLSRRKEAVLKAKWAGEKP